MMIKGGLRPFNHYGYIRAISAGGRNKSYRPPREVGMPAGRPVTSHKPTGNTSSKTSYAGAGGRNKLHGPPREIGMPAGRHVTSHKPIGSARQGRHTIRQGQGKG